MTINYRTDTGPGDTGSLKRAPKPGLPELIVNEADPTATAKELAKLIAATSEFLFNGNAPVKIAVEAGMMPRALEVTADSVLVLAHELCNPFKMRFTKRGMELIPVPLSRDIAQIYLNGLEGRWGLKPFNGITTAPILSGDGAIRIEKGYDPDTGLWCHNIPNINVPERPTEADARQALLRLRWFFQTFPFADSKRLRNDDGIEVIDYGEPDGLDESTFIAALLTVVVRASIELAPGFLCNAPAYSGAGTGKGLLIKAICIIGSGVRPSAFTSGHDAAELDKRLTSALVEAHPAVFLDNFNAKELKSDILASVLTEHPAIVRPMGCTKMVPLHNRTSIGITGNNVEIAEDMARRILGWRLDAQMEDPEQRKFAPGFLDHVLEERPALLSDALTIWRWGRQVVLKPGKPLGSYEVWAQWVRDPLCMLGMRDPVDRIAEIKAADPNRRAVVEFFDVWCAHHHSDVVKATDVHDDVIAHIIQSIDGAKPGRKEDGTLQFSRQKVARFLDSLANTRLGGYAFLQLKDPTRKRAPAQYKLIEEKREAT